MESVTVNQTEKKSPEITTAKFLVPMKEINNYSEVQVGGTVYTEGIIVNKVSIRRDKSQNPFVVAYLKDPTDDTCIMKFSAWNSDSDRLLPLLNENSRVQIHNASILRANENYAGRANHHFELRATTHTNVLVTEADASALTLSSGICEVTSGKVAIGKFVKVTGILKEFASVMEVGHNGTTTPTREIVLEDNTGNVTVTLWGELADEIGIDCIGKSLTYSPLRSDYLRESQGITLQSVKNRTKRIQDIQNADNLNLTVSEKECQDKIQPPPQALSVDVLSAFQKEERPATYVNQVQQKHELYRTISEAGDPTKVKLEDSPKGVVPVAKRHQKRHPDQ